MNMFYLLIEPEWPTSWLIKIIAERIVQESGSPEEAQGIFELALDQLVPLDDLSRMSR